MERVRDLARATMPAGAVAALPEKWERLGRVLVLRLPDALAPHARAAAEAYACVLGCDAVLQDHGVAGPMREPRMEPLLGDRFETEHVENGVRFRFDAARIMFSSGNTDERTRFPARVRDGETVVDLFAGIGYYAVPVAVHAKPARVHACELNPVAFRYLVENVAVNRVEATVEPLLGDCRDVAPRGVADRVLMGYFPGASAFLPTARATLKPKGGAVHYHDIVDAREWRADAAAIVQGAWPDARIDEVRRVKSFRPGSHHVEVVATLPSGGDAA